MILALVRTNEGDHFSFTSRKATVKDFFQVCKNRFGKHIRNSFEDNQITWVFETAVVSITGPLVKPQVGYRTKRS